MQMPAEQQLLSVGQAARVSHLTLESQHTLATNKVLVYVWSLESELSTPKKQLIASTSNPQTNTPPTGSITLSKKLIADMCNAPTRPQTLPAGVKLLCATRSHTYSNAYSKDLVMTLTNPEDILSVSGLHGNMMLQHLIQVGFIQTYHGKLQRGTACQDSRRPISLPQE